MTNRPFTYAVALLGAGHAPFLGPHLWAIRQADPDALVTVLFDRDAAHEIDLLSRAHPTVRFLRSDETLSGGRHARIARKLRHWSRLARHAGDGPVALLDVDTILQRRLRDAIDGTFDVGFTCRPPSFAGYPINTGVMLMRSGLIGARVLDTLASDAERIIHDPKLHDEAIAQSGAIDQHALRQLIGMDGYDQTLSVTIGGRPVRFRGLPCSAFNQTECEPLTAATRVVHYKAGWHPILLYGAPFTDARPRDSSREQLALFRNTLSRSNTEIARAIVASAAARHRSAFRDAAPTSFVERGILHSEMLAICATAADLGLDTIVESGRFQGQSTLVLAEWGRRHGVEIVSLERLRDANAVFAEGRLTPYDNVRLVYADALRALPRVLETLTDRRVGVLLDGPKGGPAVQLILDAFQRFPNVRAGWIHDMRLGSPQRDALDRAGLRSWCTDDLAYVEAHRDLDEACIATEQDGSPHAWRPYAKGDHRIESYGPTLAVLFPEPDRSIGTRPTQAATTQPA